VSAPRVRMSVVIGFTLLVLGASGCTKKSDQTTPSPLADTTPENTAQLQDEEPTLPDTRAKNVIMVSLDTLRADHVGFYGYNRETTPNLDRFAANAVVFENALAQASSTLPSHQSLFQSRPASAAAENRLALAEVLRQHEYRTAAYTGGINVSSLLGFARGFEVYEEQDTGLAGTFPMAASWLREHREEPFFLFLHTYDIHLPYDPPEPHASMFGESYEGSVRGNVTRDLLRRVRRLDDYDGDPFDLDEKDRAKVVALYDGGIHYTDGHLARLFKLAEELDLYRDTVFVLFADHGEEFWDHGSTIHSHTLYQELLHVPLLIRSPEISPRQVENRVPLMDVVPTILELLGIPAPDEFQGTSLRGLMTGVDMGDRVIISEQRQLKSLVDYPWKFIRDGSGSTELYQLANDPLEQNNLVKVHPGIVARLAARLNQRLAGHHGKNVPEMKPGITDPEHIEGLRALGYID
jgi:arylsulfatase A-like enzyme